MGTHRPRPVRTACSVATPTAHTIPEENVRSPYGLFMGALQPWARAQYPSLAWPVGVMTVHTIDPDTEPLLHALLVTPHPPPWPLPLPCIPPTMGAVEHSARPRSPPNPSTARVVVIVSLHGPCGSLFGRFGAIFGRF